MHVAWVTELRNSLNDGLLPEGYYAQAERAAVGIESDVLTLHESEPGSWGSGGSVEPGAGGGGAVVLESPPSTSVASQVDTALAYAGRQRRVVVKTDRDRPVAVIELVSPGNKQGRAQVEEFASKVQHCLREGLHVTMVDVHPPGSADPRGLHAAVWERLGGEPYEPAAGRERIAAAYVAWERGQHEVFAEPLALGEALPEVALFLDAGHYVNLPLDATYGRAYAGVPRKWRAVLEG